MYNLKRTSNIFIILLEICKYALSADGSKIVSTNLDRSESS